MELQDDLRQSVSHFVDQCQTEINNYISECGKLLCFDWSTLDSQFTDSISTDEEIGDIVSGNLEREIEELLSSSNSLEYLLAQHAHLQNELLKNCKRPEISPQKRIWFRNGQLKQGLQLHLTELKNRLECFLLDQYRRERDVLCNDFEKMKEQIIQPPGNSTELLTRSAYLEETRTVPLSQLMARVSSLKKHFINLTEAVTFTEEDVVKSAYVFSGPEQIVPLLDTGVEVRILFSHFHCYLIPAFLQSR